MTDVNPPKAADVLVIFGVTGDLAHAMTYHALYRRKRLAFCTVRSLAWQ